jgi:hypothetical protein
VTREPEAKSSSSLSLQTLVISSVSAVVAAAVVPLFWQRGSLIATAITPIVVALASEALNRPAKAITAAAPKVARRSATGAALRSRQPTGVGARGDGPERVARAPRGAAPPAAPPPWSGDTEDPFGLRAPEPRRRRLPLRLAVVTGLLAALIGAGVVTASELAVFGHSIGHSGRETSLFGGKATHTPAPTPTPTATPSATATNTATPTVTATPTPSATATATPQATETVAPQATTTPPPAATATPAP